jgi:hypothetical protein
VLLFVVFVLAHPRANFLLESPASSAHAACPLALFTLSPEGSLEGMLPHHFPCTPKSFRMNTCKSVSKQRTLTAFRMNTCEKQGEGVPSSGSFIAYYLLTSLSQVWNRPLFSTTSNLSFPQTLSFHTHTKTPGGGVQTVHSVFHRSCRNPRTKDIHPSRLRSRRYR